MSDKSSLGDRMKAHENVTRHILPQRTYTIIRVDGRAFHSYLRDADRPFDLIFAMQMEHLACILCAEISGARFAYHQSDEISVLAVDFGTIHSQPWFGGVVQKIASTAAATATAHLLRQRSDYGGTPTFDGRVFTISDPVEVANYFVWRQRDAVRNSVSMAAQAWFSHKSLQGLNSDQLQEKLWQEAQINWNEYQDRFKRGSVALRETYTDTVTYTDSRTGDVHEEPAERKRWVAQAAPNFTAQRDGWLAQHIPEVQGFPHGNQ